jgi:hypothetical protein
MKICTITAEKKKEKICTITAGKKGRKENFSPFFVLI